MRSYLAFIALATTLSMAGCRQSADQALSHLASAQEVDDRLREEFETKQTEALDSFTNGEWLADYSLSRGDQAKQQEYLAGVEELRTSWAKRESELSAELKRHEARLKEAKRLLEKSESL